MFPCWKYHKDAELTDKKLYQELHNPAPKEYGARIFQSEEELQIAGEGWVDSPAKLFEPEPEKAPTKAEALELKLKAASDPEKSKGKKNK